MDGIYNMNKTKRKLSDGEKVYLGITALLILAFIYFISYKIFGFRVNFSLTPCLFHDLLHLYCPGCGGTRAVQALMDFRFVDSFLYHPIVLYAAVVSAYYYIGATITYIKRDGKVYYKFHSWHVWVALIIVLGFFVLRNYLLVFHGIDYPGELLRFWN